tara:strand:- start:2079 stop:2309 length:231 start_codon:yes stop_codon:yes gene_type:complete
MAVESSIKQHFNLLTDSDISVETEMVKLDEHFGLSKDEMLELEAEADELLGVFSGIESWDDLVNEQKKITTKYVTS